MFYNKHSMLKFTGHQNEVLCTEVYQHAMVPCTQKSQSNNILF